MIRNASIIAQPYSGEYTERIYDIESVWNSGDWTWVKFDDDGEAWCGEFRGAPRGVALSKKYFNVYILTSDYLYVLDCENGEIKSYEAQPQYTSITASPRGDILIADDYSINLVKNTLDELEEISMPFQTDMLRFHEWSGNILKISCYEFLEWGKEIELFLDADSFQWCECVK